MFRWLLLIISAGISTYGYAQTTLKSPETRVHMLELFSTQSCSSCPPAQAWVSKLKNSKDVWKTFIPVVYHVDYWDYLGWKDPYSSPIYTQRQKDYVSEWFTSPAYTPMFVHDGEVTNVTLLNSQLKSLGSPVGVLEAQKLSTAGHYKIKFQPKQTYSKPLVVYYSVLGSGISTKVKAGENEGKNLKHDFLSLLLDKTSLVKTKNGYEATVRANLNGLKTAPQKHIVFWVSEDISKKPIQVVGGPL